MVNTKRITRKILANKNKKILDTNKISENQDTINNSSNIEEKQALDSLLALDDFQEVDTYKAQIEFNTNQSTNLVPTSEFGYNPN